MEKILNEIINSIPEFMKKVNDANTFVTYTKEIVVYSGIITSDILKEWDNTVTKRKNIPFIRNKLHSPCLVENQKSCKGYIYITMEYSTCEEKPYMSWGFRTSYDENPLRYGI